MLSGMNTQPLTLSLIIVGKKGRKIMNFLNSLLGCIGNLDLVQPVFYSTIDYDKFSYHIFGRYEKLYLKRYTIVAAIICYGEM